MFFCNLKTTYILSINQKVGMQQTKAEWLMGVSWGPWQHRMPCNLLFLICLSCFLALSFLHLNLLCCNLHEQRVQCVSVLVDARIKRGCLQNIWNMERGIRGSRKDVSAGPGPQIYSVDVSLHLQDGDEKIPLFSFSHKLSPPCTAPAHQSFSPLAP